MRFRVSLAAAVATLCGVLIEGCVQHDAAAECGTLTRCGDTCVPLQFDAHNCGACGHVCPFELACRESKCVDPALLVDTGGTGKAGQAGGAGKAAGEAGAAGSDSGGHPSAGGGAGSAGKTSSSSGGTASGGKAGTGGASGGKAGAGGASGAGTGGKSGSAVGGAATSAGGAATSAGGKGTGGAATGAGAGGTGGAAAGGASSTGGGSIGGASSKGGSSGAPAVFCDAPLVACGSTCVDLQTNDLHCGDCNTHCSTGICTLGACVGKALGHEVLVGMDFQKIPGNEVQPRNLLGNAVFLGAANGGGHWRVAGFDPFASPSATAVDGALAVRAPQLGITDLKVTRVSSVEKLLPLLTVAKSHAVVFYDQPKAPAGALAGMGAAVAAALDAYAHTGGIVVVLSGGQGTNEMGSLAASAGLLPVTAFDAFQGTTVLDGVALLDAVSAGVSFPFASPVNAGAWSLPAGPWSVVVRDHASLGPVVVHRGVELERAIGLQLAVYSQGRSGRPTPHFRWKLPTVD